jgi:hypothetical protein
MVTSLVRISKEVGTAEDLLQSYLVGYSTQVAILQGKGRYTTIVGNHTVYIHPTSVLFGRDPKIVSYVELVSSESGKWYIRGVNRVDVSWLPKK